MLYCKVLQLHGGEQVGPPAGGDHFYLAYHLFMFYSWMPIFFFDSDDDAKLDFHFSSNSNLLITSCPFVVYVRLLKTLEANSG